MKVLMIAPQPFFEPRGTPISVYQRLHGLSALNYEVDLVTYHVGKDIDIAGVNIHRIPNVPFVKNIRIGPSFMKVLLDILIFFKALMMLIRTRYDVIHSHEEGGIFAVLLASVFRTHHLYDMHSSLPQQIANSPYGQYRWLVKLFEVGERLIINACDAMLTIGTDLEERAAEIKPDVNQTRIENLPVHVIEPAPDQSAIDEIKEKFGLNNRRLIVYTGTFEHYQGLDLLFDSAERVCQDYPDVCFVLVGGKPEQIAQWKAEVKKKDLQDNVLFVGAVAPSETLVYLDMADVLVSPRTEGLSVPLKIYTYLYSGKPIVATNLLAHTQVLTDDNALLVMPERKAYAEGIMKVLEDPELGYCLGQKARKLAEKKYNSANFFAKLERVYQSLFFPESPTTLSPVNSSSRGLAES